MQKYNNTNKIGFQNTIQHTINNIQVREYVRRIKRIYVTVDQVYLLIGTTMLDKCFIQTSGSFYLLLSQNTCSSGSYCSSNLYQQERDNYGLNEHQTIKQYEYFILHMY